MAIPGQTGRRRNILPTLPLAPHILPGRVGYLGPSLGPPPQFFLLHLHIDLLHILEVTKQRQTFSP
jgi:hypothetical protein